MSTRKTIEFSAILFVLLALSLYFHIWKRVVFQAIEILLSSKYGKSNPRNTTLSQIWQVFEINTARVNQSAFRNFSACIIRNLTRIRNFEWSFEDLQKCCRRKMLSSDAVLLYNNCCTDHFAFQTNVVTCDTQNVESCITDYFASVRFCI